MEIAGISLLIAFAAGAVSCVSPCVIPLAGPYLGTLLGASGGASTAHRRAVLLNAGSFLLGFALFFVLLGLSAGFLGYGLRENLPLIRKVGGAFMVVIGLGMIGLVRLPRFSRAASFDPAAGMAAGYARSFVAGVSISAAWIPCIGPTLGAILTLAVNSTTVFGASVLMLTYALGLAVPFMAVALLFSRTPALVRFTSRHHRPITIAAGALIVVVGVLVYTNAFVGLNRYFNFSGAGPGAKI